jgi:hypothetical protein
MERAGRTGVPCSPRLNGELDRHPICVQNRAQQLRPLLWLKHVIDYWVGSRLLRAILQECSWKYTVEDFRALAASAGFIPRAV